MVGYAHGKFRLQRWWMSCYRSRLSDLQKIKWIHRTLVIRHITEHNSFFFKYHIYCLMISHMALQHQIHVEHDEEV
jgi:hypothetical protein